ncbi:hypothetical protein [Ethanoligenens sp.]|uniref:hypothetical protein n=1 Tax=Ethanoligenens sp. TaxID=2099655 RepID=UPI0039EB039E
MNILAELNTLLSSVLPVETGVFSGVPPDEYLVLTPMTDEFALFGDNMPLVDVSEVRISLFTKGNYLQKKKQITASLLTADFTVTDRRYIGHEDDTGYHHYAIDVATNVTLDPILPDGNTHSI